MISENEAALQCAALFKEHYGFGPTAVSPINGSGSNRRYYRLSGGKPMTTVIAVSGNSIDENEAFISLSGMLASAGVCVPEVIKVSRDGMTYLQSDCGNTSLYDFMQRHRNNEGSYDEDAMKCLRRTISCLPDIQFMPTLLKAEGRVQTCDEVFDHCYQQREFDRIGVMFDLNYFKYDFLKLTGLEFDELRLQYDFEMFADELIKDAGDTFLYRDFQSRNVMLTDKGPCFIDYQGGRKGPLHYDVASFLWQSSARFKDAEREELIDVYLQSLNKYCSVSKDVFVARLHLFVLFRILQVLGAYGFRGLWEKKEYFINSIPLALENLRHELSLGACDNYPYLKEVCMMLVDNEFAMSAQKSDYQIGSPVLSCCNKPEASISTHATNTLASHNGCATDVQSYISNDKSYLNAHPERPLVVRVYSFSFKKGIPADTTGNGGGFVFDCRSTHNPGRYDAFKPLTGLDQPVIDFLENDGEILTFLESVYKLVDFHVERFKARGFTDMQINFGCTGGRHRSVYCAQHTAEHINKLFGVEVQLLHREQQITEILQANTH